jgi:hypothetical protein
VLLQGGLPVASMKASEAGRDGKRMDLEVCGSLEIRPPPSERERSPVAR